MGLRQKCACQRILNGIKPEMCFSEDLEPPIFQKEISQCETKIARHKLITAFHFASKVKVVTPPEWSIIYGISEVSKSESLNISVQRVQIDHFVIVQPTNMVFILEQALEKTPSGNVKI